jgi:ABC-type nitrate/sulfonate/bicarbonate transport system permease component
VTDVLPDVVAVREPQRLRSVSRYTLTLFLQLLGFCLFIGAWQLAHVHNPITVPSPWAVVLDIWHNFGHSVYLEAHDLAGGKGYWYDLVYTVQNVLIGVALGTTIGVTLGLISVPVPVVSQVVNPIAATFGAAPIFVAAPFFLVWFGVVSTAQVLVVTFYTSLLLYIFSRRAAENIDQAYVESAWSLGAGRLDVFRSVYIPGTVPELVGGFRIALAGAWGLEAIAELLGAQRGIGFLINYYAEVFGIVSMVSLTLLLGCAAIVCDAIAVLVSRSLLRWTATGKVA